MLRCTDQNIFQFTLAHLNFNFTLMEQKSRSIRIYIQLKNKITITNTKIHFTLKMLTQ